MEINVTGIALFLFGIPALIVLAIATHRQRGAAENITATFIKEKSK